MEIVEPKRVLECSILVLFRRRRNVRSGTFDLKSKNFAISGIEDNEINSLLLATNRHANRKAIILLEVPMDLNYRFILRVRKRNYWFYGLIPFGLVAQNDF